MDTAVLFRLSALLWALTLVYLFSRPRQQAPVLHGTSDTYQGSCYCGADKYCLCTPSLAIDAIIEVQRPGDPEVHLVLVFRRDPPSGFYAIPGGFVNVGETVEAATIREVREETSLELDRLEQFRVYSDPRRDQRRHTVSVVFRCWPKNFTSIHSGDDAKRVELVKLREVLRQSLAFDHRRILSEYIEHYHPYLMRSLS